MGTRSATLIIRYKAHDGTWKRAEAVRGANGRIRTGYARIDGDEVQVADFRYEVRFYESRKLRYKPAGKKGPAADSLRDQIEKQNTVKAAAKAVGVKVEIETDRKTLTGTAAAYIRDAEQRGAMEAAEQARLVKDEFLRTTRKTYVDEINREDIFRFHEVLRKRGCEDRTVKNKHQRLSSWLRFAGVDKGILPPTPRYEEALPTIYARDQISTLLANASPTKRMMVLIGLKLGLRDQELQFAEFSDIDWAEKTFRVRGKPVYGFKPKTWEQRDIPIPEDLVTDLREWKAIHPSQQLILPTSTGNPSGKLLKSLKTLARQSGLNCGHCRGCKGKPRECREYTLHQLRRTYVTRLLQSEIDLRTVQAYAGHKDIASTMRYLRPASAKDAQEKLNKVKW